MPHGRNKSVPQTSIGAHGANFTPQVSKLDRIERTIDDAKRKLQLMNNPNGSTGENGQVCLQDFKF